MSPLRRSTAIVAVACLACFGEKGALEPSAPAGNSLGALAVTPSAMIIAVNGTRQMSLDVASLEGQSLTDLDTVLYRFQTPADSAFLRVSAAGLITALQPTNLSRINVFVFRKGQIKGAQVLVQVTQTQVAGATLSIQPTDSTRLAAGSLKSMTPTVRNAATGQSVASPVVRYSSRREDAKRVAFHQPTITFGSISVQRDNAPVAPLVNQIGALDGQGTAWVYGSVDAYGTVLRDSVLFTLTYPFTVTIAATKTVGAVTSVAKDQALYLAPGATVTFQNSVTGTDPLTIAYSFDNAAAATAASPASTTGGSAGNVTPLAAGQTSRRRFMTAGTYLWTATAAGGPAPWAGQTLSGTIVIK